MPRRISIVWIGLALLLGACGGGSDRESGDAAVKRYCDLSDALDGRAASKFAPLPDEPSPSQIRTAFYDFLTEASEEIREIQEVAPPSIRADVQNVVQAQRRAADGDTEAMRQNAQAEQRVRTFEEERCPRKG